MLKKVAGLIRQDTAVGYYRIGQPIYFLDKVLTEKCRITPCSWTNRPTTIGEVTEAPAWSDKTLMEIVRDADIIWTNLLFSQEEILKVLNLRKWSGAKWVVDIDDHMYAVSTDNPAQKEMMKLRPYYETCLHAADGVTVSVPYLKDLYAPLNEHIFVNPNQMDLNWWGEQEKAKRKGIRIGWRGAHGHRGDITLVKPAIEALQKKYGVEFVSFGVKPPFSSEHHDWVNFLDYPKKLASLGLDMAVVPLVDSDYNKGKSNLAVLEYSSLGIPVVASPVLNQKDMPLLYATNNYQWYEELERLIKSPKLRKERGESQYKFVKQHFNAKHVQPLINWFDSLPRRTDLEP